MAAPSVSMVVERFEASTGASRRLSGHLAAQIAVPKPAVRSHSNISRQMADIARRLGRAQRRNLGWKAD